jgi:putative flippase GtrA
MTLRRFLRFNLASALGIGVQMGTLWLCLHGASLHYLPATAVAVTAAVLHNFVWHWRWTWGDRAIPATAAPAVLARFALANGAVSLASNLAVVSLLVGAAGLDALPASLMAIAAGGLINFYLGDRAVFLAPATARRRFP